MIRNFEDLTANLNDDDKNIARIVKAGLKKYKGKSNAIAGSKICSGFHSNTKIKITPVKLRKIINYLRNEGEPICSSSKGYFYPICQQEIKDTCISIQQRIDSQAQVINQLSQHI